MVQATNHMRRRTEENRGDDTQRMLKTVDTLPLTDQQISDLLYLNEEEKLARDICAFFWKKHDIVIFETVMNTEKHHVDLMKKAKSTYVPEKSSDHSKAGVYTNHDLQDLYTEMTKKSTSVHKALLNAALMAETAILDVRDAISDLDGKHSKLAKVYDTLLDDSEDHLRIFAGILKDLDDDDYEAQHDDMDQDDVDDILDHHDWHHGDHD
jgi:hypothetical protein